MIKQEGHNVRIIKNAFFLYVRMFFVLIVSLYTSRVVLDVLGVEDYGIWNVVGCVVSMFTFLGVSMSSCTSRFLSYYLGKKDFAGLQKIFSTALTVHVIIAILFCVVCETVGLWFLNNKLIIPEDREVATMFVYQIVIVSSMISIMQVPFRGMIMAFEQMKVYAYIEVFNVCAKLLIVYLLLASPIDKLVSYGIFNLFVCLIVFIVYLSYCHSKIGVCKLIFSTEKKVMKEMVMYSLWDSYGNISCLVRTHGVSLLLNMFFTVTMNAANAIANSVQGAIMGFASNVLSAFRPGIVKTYSVGNQQEMCGLIRKASILTSYMLLLFTMPIMVETEYILHLWLKNPPLYTATLCRWCLIFNVVANFSCVLMAGVHATGNIRQSSFVNGSFYMLVIPVSYFAYRYGCPAEFAFIFNVFTVCVGMIQNMYVLQKYVGDFKIGLFVRNILLKFILVGILVYGISVFLKSQLEESFLRLCVLTIFDVLLFSVMTYFWIASEEERLILKSRVSAFVNTIFRRK